MKQIWLTYTNILIIQLGRSVPEVSKATVLAVLPSSVVFAAYTSYNVDKVNIAAAVWVTIALTVW